MVCSNQTCSTVLSHHDHDDGITVLTCEYVDQILRYYLSNETTLTVLSHGTFCFLAFYKMKVGGFAELSLWPILRLKGVMQVFL